MAFFSVHFSPSSLHNQMKSNELQTFLSQKFCAFWHHDQAMGCGDTNHCCCKGGCFLVGLKVKMLIAQLMCNNNVERMHAVLVAEVFVIGHTYKHILRE